MHKQLRPQQQDSYPTCRLAIGLHKIVCTNLNLAFLSPWLLVIFLPYA